MTIEQVAAELVRAGYTDLARVGNKFRVGRVIYIGNDRYLERGEAERILKVLK